MCREFVTPRRHFAAFLHRPLSGRLGTDWAPPPVVMSGRCLTTGSLTFVDRRRTLVWFGTSGQVAQMTPERPSEAAPLLFLVCDRRVPNGRSKRGFDEET
jgi:hypothetical protein